MKKLILALATGSMAFPVMAQTVIDTTNNQYVTQDSYSNRGQCESALAHVRNTQRSNGDRGGEPYNSMSNGEYNKASATTTRCEKNAAGEYVIVYYANGFPG
jgi:hypothetical protein